MPSVRLDICESIATRAFIRSRIEPPVDIKLLAVALGYRIVAVRDDAQERRRSARAIAYHADASAEEQQETIARQLSSHLLTLARCSVDTESCDLMARCLLLPALHFRKQLVAECCILTLAETYPHVSPITIGARIPDVETGAFTVFDESGRTILHRWVSPWLDSLHAHTSSRREHDLAAKVHSTGSPYRTSPRCVALPFPFQDRPGSGFISRAARNCILVFCDGNNLRL